MITAFGEIAERLRRWTVQVTLGRDGQGSGVVWDSGGVIVTNAHVARKDTQEVLLWDGRRYPAATLFRDDARDLAALQIHAPSLEAAAIGDSGRLSPGELVIAVGNPMGFVGALTTGVVHATGPVAGFTRRDYVQATVRLAPGNSGGPLADAQGRVIGINSMVVMGGLGLAIPSNAVRDFLLRQGRRATIGAGVRSVRVRLKSREVPGLVIVEIVSGGPADRASLMVGDILIAAGGRAFETFDDLSWAIERSTGNVTLKFLRGDRRTVREATLQLPYVEARAA